MPSGTAVGVLVVSGRRGRRVVSVGVLTLGERGWVVANDVEVRLLEALRGERVARNRLWALAAGLDASVVDAADLRRLNGRLAAITAVAEPEELWDVWVDVGLMAAVAYVCVCVNDVLLSRWLGFALAVRLDANLVRGLLPGPGWVSWDAPHRLRSVTFDRDVHWISELPESFWVRLTAHSDKRLRAVAVASDPSSKPTVLEKLVDEHRREFEVLDLVASNPRTPTRVLRSLAMLWQRGERLDLRVGQNRCATAGLLDELSRWGREVRFVVAWHPKVPQRTLRHLARDEWVRVRAAVAGAVSAPLEVLEMLASDQDVQVRRNVASNPSTARAVLEALLTDRRAEVRAAATKNENTPAQMVATLVGDRAIKVRAAVASRRVGTDVLTVLAADPKGGVRQATAFNVQTPTELLERLASDCCEEVRAAVAYNTNAPLTALTALARDEFRYTKANVAANESVPDDLLVVLAADHDSHVRGTAAENPAMPAAQLKTLATDEFWGVRAGVALNPKAGDVLLAMLCEDHDSHVRRCVCEYDNAPLRLVNALRCDADFRVRAAATAACKRRAQTTPDTTPQAETTCPDQKDDEGET